jgi:hypothetical protein
MTVYVANAHVQRLVSVVKMAIVLEDCTIKEQCSVVCFLWAKGLSAKDTHKEMFPVYGGNHLPCKAVHNGVEKHGKCFTDDEEVETEAWKWLRQQSKDFYAAGLDALLRDGTSASMLVNDMLRNKGFFQVQISHVLLFISICDLFTDSPSYI